MTELGWKKIERLCAEIIGGTRYPANVGGAIDVESETWAGQVKHLRECSLEALTALCETTDAEAKKRGKLGMVLVKVKRGRGKMSPVLCVMLAGAWQEGDGHDA